MPRRAPQAPSAPLPATSDAAELARLHRRDQIFEHSQTGLLVFAPRDATGAYVLADASLAAAPMLAGERAACLGLGPEQALRPPYGSHATELLRRDGQGETAMAPLAVREGTVTYGVGITRLPSEARVVVRFDMTRLADLHRAVEQSERRHRLALQAARLVPWTIDAAARAPAVDRHLAADPAVAAIMAGCAEGGQLHPDDMAKADEVAAAIFAGTPPQTFELRHLHGGLTYWLRSHCTAGPAAEGESAQIFGVTQDVSEFRQTEALLLHEARTLASKMDARTERLEEDRRLLAHELHQGVATALTAASLHLRLARSATASGSAAGYDCAAHLLQSAIGRLRELAFDLRPPILDELGLAGALRWMAEATARAWPGEVTCTVELGDLKAVPRHCETLVFRFAEQALAQARGRRVAGSIDLQAREARGKLQVTVRDEGPQGGIDEQDRQAAMAALCRRIESYGGRGGGVREKTGAHVAQARIPLSARAAADSSGTGGDP